MLRTAQISETLPKSYHDTYIGIPEIDVDILQYITGIKMETDMYSQSLFTLNYIHP
jgi:hypothetical protein